MIISVMVQRFYRCTCGKKWRTGTIHEAEQHVRIAPHQCQVHVHLREVVGDNPRTGKQIEQEFGLPFEMIDLDPPVGGLYYSYWPVWSEWLPVPDFGRWLSEARLQ